MDLNPLEKDRHYMMTMMMIRYYYGVFILNTIDLLKMNEGI